MCSVSLANEAVGCISGGGLLRMLSMAVDWSGMQSFVFVVVSSFVVSLRHWRIDFGIICNVASKSWK